MARFTEFTGYLHWGVSFFGKEVGLILKNKMAAAGISLKIIYIFYPTAVGGRREKFVRAIFRKP